ncbi:hypothetical protein EV567_2566 [Streptomyces sp. BK239]|nr:hypothetical protein EV567_2566 [Streptomyces sp. BK239]
MHDIALLLPGSLYLFCILVPAWELGRKSTGRKVRKLPVFAAVVALGLTTLPGA